MNLDLNKHFSKNYFSNSHFIKLLGGALEEMKYYTVDRQEGNYTILENTVTHKHFEVETAKLPPFLEDGDILKKEGVNYEFDFFKTAQLKREIKKQMNELQK